MFKIGQHVIHPGQGVCTVVGFSDEGPAPMILLRARSGRSETHLSYPLSQQNRLHEAISRDAAEDLLATYAELDVDPFTERNSSLEETHFKQQLKLGAPETVRVAKTMRCRIAEAEARGKKPSSYYARVLKEARKRSIEEFAVALDAEESEIEQRFMDAVAAAGELAALN
ncbi:MAG: CarD family transcriptional regulator [Coriobacteriaceae bacterium]|nr:CarD family transcriptional regulator [Coriobacteriaceae bacterium]